jgi:hypothetical protein
VLECPFWKSKLLSSTVTNLASKASVLPDFKTQSNMGHNRALDSLPFCNVVHLRLVPLVLVFLMPCYLLPAKSPLRHAPSHWILAEPPCRKFSISQQTRFSTIHRNLSFSNLTRPYPLRRTRRNQDVLASLKHNTDYKSCLNFNESSQNLDIG